MLFNSVEYLVFLIAVFAGFWALARLRVARSALLLVASYVFYMSWNPSFLLLIIGSTVLDYVCGARIAAGTSERGRRLFLVASLVGNLGLLAFFKYTNFFWGSALDLGQVLGLPLGQLPRHFDILLPVGISFYTFQTMSYSLDIYRGRLAPTRSLLDFALYVAFFPQLVAGPIVRARDFLPQLEQAPRLDAQRASDAFFLILRGMVKKVAIADYLAINLVDRAFDNPGWYSSPELFVALLGYALQIYCDFSAYTDIARGSAKLLGFELPENFRRPYQAQDVAEFWQRWHMSLTTWIRDYLYISMGGSRGGVLATYRNLMATWLIMGLWHGANWTFVAWGGYFGVLLSIDHFARRGGKRRPRRGGVWGAVRTAWTIVLVTLGWLLFRAESFTAAGSYAARMLWGLHPGLGQIPAGVWLALGLGWAVHLSPEAWQERAREAFGKLPAPLQGVAAAGLAALLLLMADESPTPFIYFQF